MPLFLGEGMTTTYNIKATENLMCGSLLISQIQRMKSEIVFKAEEQ